MLKYFIIILSAIFTISCKQSDPVEKDINSSAIWEDNFDGEELDKDKWEIMLGDGSNYGLWRWGNEEEQYYTSENIIVSDGKLKIKAQAEEKSGYYYTSGRIRSLNKGDFKYGRIEASIKMDISGGLWNAFWMLPSNPSEGWPKSGEIDIMEHVGNTPDQILNYVHFADAFKNHQSKGDFEFVVQDENFHQYAIEWNQNEITWYTDSLETLKILRSEPELNATWPFDAKFHILLNTAIGGTLGGNVDSISLLQPKYMEVDYVKVYQ